MTRTWLLLLSATIACRHDAAPPLVAAPVRDAVGDADVRMLVTEIATEKACDRIRDRFHALRAAGRHDVVTGVLWFRGCTSVHDGMNVTFTLSGSGWQWVDKTMHKVGGTFAVHQYVRFDAKATIAGVLDLGYDGKTHVASLWFSPSREPVVTLDPIGGVDVDHSGAWSSVVGGVATALLRSPDREGVSEAKREGTAQFTAELAEGLTITVDLCTGLARTTVGHTPKGELAPPDVIEPSTTEFELQPGGVLMLGPQRAQDGMTVHVESAAGGAASTEVALACRDDAEAIARAYLAGAAPPAITPLAHARVDGVADLTIPAAHCPVAVIARSLAPTGTPVELSIRRSSAEIGVANGGPLVGCGR